MKKNKCGHINPHWKIKDEVKNQLPELVLQSKKLQISREDQFLKLTQLRLPNEKTAQGYYLYILRYKIFYIDIVPVKEIKEDVSKQTKDQYFGSEAKSTFYKVFHKMAKQQHLYLGSIDDYRDLLELGISINETFNLFNHSVVLDHSDVLDHSEPPNDSESKTSTSDSKLIQDSKKSTSGSYPNIRKDSKNATARNDSITTTTTSGSDSINSTTTRNDSNIQTDSKTTSTTRKDSSKDSAEVKLPLVEKIGLFDKPLTARHRFAAKCLEEHLPPCASMILRKTFTEYIDLGHMGMGDRLAVVFATCLDQLPLVNRLNMRDNRLTDVGVGAIINAAIGKKSLKSFDISENKIDGEAAEALARYLATGSCTIEELSVSNADIDDGEVLGFAKAIHYNRSLRTLDLSNNLIGNKESLNVVQPDLITGGEALAEMLVVNNSLTKLDLSWNSIRMNSAVELGRALAQNTGLKILTLAYNAFANAGAQAIGEALLTNSCLEVLDLSNNNIPGQAAFVIAGALQVNATLISLIMDGNPLGAIGGRTLLQSVADSGNTKLTLSINKCNFECSSTDLFNPDEATGSYDLDMTNPYEHSVAVELLKLANTKNGCKFVSIVHIVDLKQKNVNLELRPIPKSRTHCFSRKSEVRSTTPINRTKLTEVFHELDQDGSGAIDSTELEIGMRQFGMEPREGEANRLIASFDLDNTGSIELDEFIELMSEFAPSEEEMVEVVDVATGYRFSIPTDGRLTIEFLDLHIPAKVDEAASGAGVERLIQNLSTCSNRVQMFEMVKQGMRLKAEDGQKIIDNMLEVTDLVSAMAIILPHIIEPRQAHQLIDYNMMHKDRLLLQQLLGQQYGPIIGLESGHYKMDLSVENDRHTARKLLQVSNRTMIYRKKHDLGDTSQHEDYSGFRNAVLNGSSTTINSAFFDKMPKFGTLEFDFVSMARPEENMKSISSARFTQLLEKLHLEAFTSIHESRTQRKRVSTAQCFDSMLHFQERAMSPFAPNDDKSLADPVKVILDDGSEMVWTARRVVSELQAILGARYITAKQAVKLLSQWPKVYAAWRVEVVIIVFGRITDLYNFHRITSILTDTEVASAYYRLGFLNVWSPLSPDDYYELDLSILEQRKIATMLVQLALDEPGENWQDVSFGWSRQEPMPGWELNMSWLKPGGFPERGYLCLRYYSGADLGCSPVWSTRKDLNARVLAELPHNFEEFADSMSRSLALGSYES